MKPSIPACAAMAILTQLAAVYAQARGGESGGGGAEDYRVVPAFFLDSDADSKPVTACYEATQDFGLPPAFLAQTVRQAFEQWAQYLPAKKLDIVPTHVTIRTQLELHAGCRGGENLMVYFGVENDQVRQYRSQYVRPFGFAQLVTPGEQQDGFGNSSSARGLIWIAPHGWVDAQQAIPSWSPATQDALAALVLHEVGHVFGNGHVDGTVMTEKIGRYLEADTAPGAQPQNLKYYGKIDARIELVPCPECRMAYTAAETFDPSQPPGQESDWKYSFELLMGRAPVPPMAMRYERLGSPQGSGMLTVQDALGQAKFPVTTFTVNGTREDSTPLFYGQGGTSFRSSGISYLAHLTTAGGASLEVTLNYNMADHKAEILPHQGFYPRPIFVSGD